MPATDNLSDVLRQHRAFQRGLHGVVRDGCDAAGREIVEFARSITSEIRPPARKGEGERLGHPGHWADDTKNLANAYDSDAGIEGDRVYCEVSNSMEYAAALDAKDDYWVLRGLETGGHAKAALDKWVPDALRAHEARYSNREVR